MKKLRATGGLQERVWTRLLSVPHLSLVPPLSLFQFVPDSGSVVAPVFVNFFFNQ